MGSPRDRMATAGDPTLHLLTRPLAAALACAIPSGAAFAADSNVAIGYTMTVAGLPIGTAALKLSIADNGPYKIVVSAKVGGVLKLVSDGKGSATASGRLGPAQPIPAGFALKSVSGKKPQTIRMALAGGTVTDAEIKPEPTPRPDRVPVTPADKRGVIDPLSAMIVPVPAGGRALDPALCARTLPIFDGGQRFDIRLAYSRLEKVKVKGFAGQALVCAARYVPIAGHRSERDQTKFMAANRDIELWLAQVGDTPVLAPVQIAMGTQVGRFIVTAARIDVSVPGQMEARN